MSDWLLPFTSSDPDAPTGDGRPWGDGTAIAARARHSGGPPWDEGCTGTTLIGGYATMSAYHQALTDLIDHPGDGPAYSGGRWQRGHVYLAGWRLNAVRDLAPASTDPWPTGQDPTRLQDSVAGLLLRLMQTAIQIRLLVWYPAAGSRIGAKLGPHIEDAQYLARVIGQASEDLTSRLSGLPSADPLGVVALDMRVCNWPAGAHHQKMMVIRLPRINVAFVVGVDLALTRRDEPASDGGAGATGDWQSGALSDSHVLGSSRAVSRNTKDRLNTINSTMTSCDKLLLKSITVTLTAIASGTHRRRPVAATPRPRRSASRRARSIAGRSGRSFDGTATILLWERFFGTDLIVSVEPLLAWRTRGRSRPCFRGVLTKPLGLDATV